MELNPWGSETIKDYDKLTKEFGIQKMPDFGIDNLYFRRGIIFGHRDFDKFWHAKNRSVLTGIMPSGPMHLGHKMVVDQCVFYQSLGIKTRVLVADIEARTTRGISKEQSQKIALEEYLPNWIALGLDPKKADIYAQTNRSVPYYSFYSLLSARTTMNEMRAIYGELTPGKMTSALVQMGDILHPQLPEYDGPEHVLVPVGADQDPHIRFARGFAEKEHLIKPSATYHRFATGLEGGKMSSSRENSYIALNDPVDVAVKKASNALTGGRNTAAEQREKGGDISHCVVYELYAYHFAESDKELADIRRRCTSGEMLCGECKQILKGKVEKFMADLAKKREKAKKQVDKMELF